MTTLVKDVSDTALPSAATITVGTNDDTVDTTADTSSEVSPGMYLQIGTEHFLITGVDASVITLSSPHLGASVSGGAATYGQAVPGALPASYNSVEISDLTGGSPYEHVLHGLSSGTAYSVRVSSSNALGYSQPRYSSPSSLAPPKQKASEPIGVQLVSNSATQLKVVWNHPVSDGGDTVTKYLIEWDTAPTFNSGGGGVSLGSHESAHGAGDCNPDVCDHIIQGLSQGPPYHVRIYAYNTFGYSNDHALSSPIKVAPTSQPGKVQNLAVAPVGTDALKVSWDAPANEGGTPITKYRIQWDAMDAVGQENGATSVL